MRCRSWCSCAGAALLLAGCGGGASPYADPHTPLRYGDTVAGANARVVLHKIAFAGAGGAPIYGYLVTPAKPGRYPAVLFLHGSGGRSTDFLDWADVLAQKGGVGMTIQEPNDATDYAPLVVNARRALDALAQLPDVDRSRLGVMGFSLGAQTAAILSGVDRRPKAVVLMSCRGTGEVLSYVRHAHAHFLVQAGTLDEIVPRAQLKALARAVPPPKTVQWYEAPHSLTVRALLAQIAWLRSQLRQAR
jgi:dienelactone hydrolase